MLADSAAVRARRWPALENHGSRPGGAAGAVRRPGHGRAPQRHRAARRCSTRRCPSAAAARLRGVSRVAAVPARRRRSRRAILPARGAARACRRFAATAALSGRVRLVAGRPAAPGHGSRAPVRGRRPRRPQPREPLGRGGRAGAHPEPVGGPAAGAHHGDRPRPRAQRGHPGGDGGRRARGGPPRPGRCWPTRRCAASSAWPSRWAGTTWKSSASARWRRSLEDGAAHGRARAPGGGDAAPAPRLRAHRRSLPGRGGRAPRRGAHVPRRDRAAAPGPGAPRLRGERLARAAHAAHLDPRASWRRSRTARWRSRPPPSRFLGKIRAHADRMAALVERPAGAVAAGVGRAAAALGARRRRPRWRTTWWRPSPSWPSGRDTSSSARRPAARPPSSATPTGCADPGEPGRERDQVHAGGRPRP